MLEIAGIIISIIGVVVAIVIYQVQKTTRKHKVRREIVDFIKSKVQTRQDMSAQYIGAETATICRKNKIKKIDIVEIIEDLISEYSAIRNKNTNQIIDKLIKIRTNIAQIHLQKNQRKISRFFFVQKYDKNIISILNERMANEGDLLSRSMIINKTDDNGV